MPKRNLPLPGNITKRCASERLRFVTRISPASATLAAA